MVALLLVTLLGREDILVTLVGRDDVSVTLIDRDDAGELIRAGFELEKVVSTSETWRLIFLILKL